MMTAHVTVEGPHADIQSLWAWLGDVPELRGGLQESQEPVPDGAMGADLAIGVILSGVALVRALTPLTREVLNYLKDRARQGRFDIVVVTGPKGRVELTAHGTSAAEAEKLLRQALQAPEPTDGVGDSSATGRP
jgi:hypothetical protein